MGAWAQTILQGIGRTGSEVAQGKDIALDEQAKKLQMLQSQLGLQQLRQKLGMEAAPQYVGSYAGPSGQRFNTTRNPLTGALSDQPGGQQESKGTFKPLLTESGDYVLYNDVTGKQQPFVDEKGAPIKGFPKGKSGPLMINGKPGGVIRNGQPLTPDSPNWTPQDAVQLANYLKTYGEGEEAKNKRIQLASQSRVEAYMKTRMYAAMDAQNGSLVYITPSQMSQNPGRYAPAGPAVQAKNRAGIFQEIDTATNFLNDAITKLPNDAFDPAARLQIAAALRSPDPESAMHEFFTSDVAATLSEPQIEYVTTLKNMQESALALRSVAGLGQGSDKLRDAITQLLPGAGTPSKAYAIRQMKIFRSEVNALRTTVPTIGEPGQGGGQTPNANQPPPGATVIPWDQVK
jgi:hypothetical protein